MYSFEVRSTFLIFGRNVPQTHYEVLGLPNDCSAKDIKDAYIKLSKKVNL